MGTWEPGLMRKAERVKMDINPEHVPLSQQHWNRDGTPLPSSRPSFLDSFSASHHDVAILPQGNHHGACPPHLPGARTRRCFRDPNSSDRLYQGCHPRHHLGLDRRRKTRPDHLQRPEVWLQVLPWPSVLALSQQVEQLEQDC